MAERCAESAELSDKGGWKRDSQNHGLNRLLGLHSHQLSSTNETQTKTKTKKTKNKKTKKKEEKREFWQSTRGRLTPPNREESVRDSNNKNTLRKSPTQVFLYFFLYFSSHSKKLKENSRELEEIETLRSSCLGRSTFCCCCCCVCVISSPP